MIITLNRKELCELLGVTTEGLKKIIQRNTLQDRIGKLDVGYKFLESYREGRSTFYKLEVKTEKEDNWLRLQKYYNIRKKEEHTKYSFYRMTEDLTSTKAHILKHHHIDISSPTAKKFDDILLNEKAIEEDNMVYFLINTSTDEMTEITELEYKNFWKDNKVVNMAISNVNKKRAKYEISESFADYSKYSIIRELGNKEGMIAIKFMTYKEAENSKIILDMIKNNIKKENKK